MQLCSLEALVVQYRSGSGTNFFKIHAVLLIVYIIHATRINQDHLQSVIESALVRMEPGNIFV